MLWTTLQTASINSLFEHFLRLYSSVDNFVNKHWYIQVALQIESWAEHMLANNLTN